MVVAAHVLIIGGGPGGCLNTSGVVISAHVLIIRGGPGGCLNTRGGWL